MAGTGEHRMPRRRRRHFTIALAVVLTAGAAGGATAALHTGSAPRSAPEEPAHLGTVKITRTDLSSSRIVPGTLGHGRTLTLKGKGDGVLTKVPAPGTETVRGKALYWVDDRPVPVFFGDTPFFRTLAKTGTRGHDVRVLADNLRALGYQVGATATRAATPLPAGEDEFTPALSAALKRWQHDTGQQATGTLAPSHALVLPGAVRVDTVAALPGDPVAGEVLTYTTTTKSIAVKMDAAEVGAVREGQAVTITLPDTRSVPGKVTAISSVVQGGGGLDPSEQADSPTVMITVRPQRAEDVKALEVASVQVRFTTTAREHVLAVPVTALLALQEGGYALQRPDSSLLPVKTGMIADGLVEISGPGVRQGLAVVTSS